MTSDNGEMAPGAYRSLGLLCNPFYAGKRTAEFDYPGLALIAHAAANDLMSAIDASSEGADSPPVWVQKSSLISVSYFVTPLARVLKATATDELATNVLTGYMPLDMMRRGRVRAVLSVIAERVAGAEFDLTLAAWIRQVISGLDKGLPEYEAIRECDLGVIDSALAEDPAGTVELYFGSKVAAREGAEDTELLMRVSVARQEALEPDPEETEAVSPDDEAPDDPYSEALAPVGDVGVEHAESVTEDETPVPEGFPPVEDFVAYLLAYTSAHLSPVVARGLRVYREKGLSAMTQELKITKAPTKTLTALCRFADCRFRRVAILIDRFDTWHSVPDDLRMKIVGALSQMRFALRGLGVLVLLASSEQTPELAEQFAAATRVEWDMKGLVEVGGMGPAFDAEVAQHWIDSATLSGREPTRLSEEPLARLLPAEEAPLAAIADRLATAIEHAAERGLARVDEAAVLAALEPSDSGA